MRRNEGASVQEGWWGRSGEFGSRCIRRVDGVCYRHKRAGIETNGCIMSIPTRYCTYVDVNMHCGIAEINGHCPRSARDGQLLLVPMYSRHLPTYQAYAAGKTATVESNRQPAANKRPLPLYPLATVLLSDPAQPPVPRATISAAPPRGRRTSGPRPSDPAAAVAAAATVGGGGRAAAREAGDPRGAGAAGTAGGGASCC